MTATEVLAKAPRRVRQWALHFECAIEDAVAAFAASLVKQAKVLDAGAGEGRYKRLFKAASYTGVDLAIGDARWNYGRLDAVAHLNHLPFPGQTFDAALNIVTLEHLTDPDAALREIARTLKSGGRLLLATPFEWEEHQQPNDYFRYTRYGLRLLLERSGFQVLELRAVGGYFRLLSRRCLNGLQFFMKGARWILFAPAAMVFIPLSLLLPLFEPFDAKQTFTLGYICIAQKLP